MTGRRFAGALRKGFLINGKPAQPGTLHAPYLKSAYNLLEQVLADADKNKLAQRERSITLADGTRLMASTRFGQNEIRIDVPAGKDGSETKLPMEERTTPYLWVGARIDWTKTAPGWFDDRHALGLHVFEPGINGIVGNHVVADWQYENVSSGWSYKLANPRPEGVTPGHWVLDNTSNWQRSSGLTYTRHGLYCAAAHLYDLSICQDANQSYDGSHEYPYDPKAPGETRISGYGETIPLWDTVVVLDPDTAQTPSDRRELLRIPELLEQLGVSGQAMVLPGNYVIKLGAMGGCTEVPLFAELEVRVGKGANAKTQRFNVEIPFTTQEFRPTFPYGWNTPPFYSTPCAFQQGNNPHAGNFWQSAVLVNVRNNSISLQDNFVPEHGFEPAPYNFSWECDPVTPTDIYIMVARPWATPFDSEWPKRIAYCVIFWDDTFPWATPSDSAQAAASQQVNEITSLAPNIEGLYYWNAAAKQFEARAFSGSAADATWVDTYSATSLAAGKRFRGITIGYTTYTEEPAFVCPDA